jgi:phage-related protein
MRLQHHSRVAKTVLFVMSDPIYRRDKLLVWLEGEIQTPPFSKAARLEAGKLLRRLQAGELIGLPQSRPLPIVGLRCHELRIPDAQHAWRIVYRIERDAIVILEVFSKKTDVLPKRVVDACRRQLAEYVRAR